jgi:hypothetical protein
MLKIVIAWAGLSLAVALTPLPAAAQTTQAGVSVASATAIPNRATVRSGTHRTRSHHRNTLNRQKARATAEQQRQRRGAPNR